MAGLDPAIHLLRKSLESGMDARVKPAHDEVCVWYGPGSAAHHAVKNGALRCVRGTKVYAAFFLALISLRLIRHSAIWIAFSAAPLRRLSDTHHSDSPFSTVASSRMRLI